MRTSEFVKYAAVAVALVLGACNTVEGVGQDVQSAGEAVEDVAN